MRVLRVSLPGSATVAANDDLLLVEAALNREAATLAVTGLLPQAHPDVVDHWMDQVFPRTHPLVRPIPVPAAAELVRGPEPLAL